MKADREKAALWALRVKASRVPIAHAKVAAVSVAVVLAADLAADAAVVVAPMAR